VSSRPVASPKAATIAAVETTAGRSQGLEPTFTAPGCTSLIVTTGAGPANPSADYWRRCLADEGLHHSVFEE
jgi:hypothetical protein